MSVKVEQLTKIYHSQKAVDQLSFKASKGEILGFLGPNGAGKTTTMKIITCFLPQTSGRVEVCGYDVATESMNARKVIGYLPEHNPLYKDMYVKEYLNFVGRLHKVKKLKTRVKEMVELTGLTREQNKQIGALSKGYRQRVGLAQAMIHDPQVLILDEPTSGLDPNQLDEIRGLIKRIGQEKTVIFSTHIMQEVQALCDRVVIINKGKLVANDSIEQLKIKLTGKKATIVAFEQKMTNKDLMKIKGVAKVEPLKEGRWRLISDQDIRANVFNYAVNTKLTLLELSPQVSSVEDVFNRLTN
ncbi:MAG: gliding motility-associated ABC transporter ATP-binding subunit GldA [Bacteroidota bacterium]